jgi:hypothetical protein
LREVAVTDILDDSYESDLTDEEHERLILMSEHAIAKPLSTEARKVFEAFNSEFDWVEDGVPGPQFNSIAAALRAAALHLHAEEEETCGGCSYALMIEVDDLLSLANELESL